MSPATGVISQTSSTPGTSLRGRVRSGCPANFVGRGMARGGWGATGVRWRSRRDDGRVRDPASSSCRVIGSSRSASSTCCGASPTSRSSICRVECSYRGSSMLITISRSARLEPLWADLSGVTDPEDAASLLADAAARTPGAAWIRGCNWSRDDPLASLGVSSTQWVSIGRSSSPVCRFIDVSSHRMDSKICASMRTRRIHPGDGSIEITRAS